jgi:hypothetical protein
MADVIVPVRLLIHFQTSARPLLQVTLARREGNRLVGVGTRAINLGGGDLALVDSNGNPTGEVVTMAHALAVVQSLARRT